MKRISGSADERISGSAGKRIRTSPLTRSSAHPLAVGIVGPGRAGIALAVALRKAGVRVLGLHGRRRKKLPPGLRLSTGALPAWLRSADVILLAVQDDELRGLVAELSGPGVLRRGQIVLHLSGVRDSGVLNPLRRAGVVTGGLHPLMTAMGDAPVDAANLSLATFALEGSPRALRAGKSLAAAIRAATVRLRPGARALYHAGAVFAANYVVTMMATAEDLLVRAGYTRRGARNALVPLSGAALVNVARSGPLLALTGPIVRGDAETVGLNLRSMRPAERDLYRCAGEVTLALARKSGRLTAGRAAAVRRALRHS